MGQQCNATFDLASGIFSEGVKGAREYLAIFYRAVEAGLIR